MRRLKAIFRVVWSIFVWSGIAIIIIIGIMCKKAVVRTAGKIHPLYEIGACSLYQMDRLFVDRGRYFSFCLEVILLALTTHLMNAVESLGFRSKAYRN